MLTNVKIGPTNAPSKGQVVNTRKKPSKLQTGELGEKIVAEHFRRNGINDVRSINVGRNNAPVDLVADSEDCGQVFRLIADTDSDRSRTAFR